MTKHPGLNPQLIIALAACLLLSGCNFKLGGEGEGTKPHPVANIGGGNGDANGQKSSSEPWRIQSAHFHDPLTAVASNAPVALRAARNETIDFAIQLNDFPDIKPRDKRPFSLRLNPLKLGPSTIPAQSYKACQVLPMPVDTNQAAFVRHTGLLAASRQLPRALLPLPMNNGAVPLTGFRNPSDPTNPSSNPP